MTQYSDNLCMLPSLVHMPSLVQRQAAIQESNCVFARLAALLVVAWHDTVRQSSWVTAGSPCFVMAQLPSWQWDCALPGRAVAVFWV